MKFVSRVESTLKVGCALDLGPRTLLVGPNGSGKTTVLQSITLAACGFALDVEERAEVHMHTTLARLFPEAGPWTSKIVLRESDPQLFSVADPTEFTWELTPSGKGFKKPEPPPMALHFPVQAVLGKLLGSPDSVRGWLAQQVCPTLSTEEFLAKLPPAAREEAGAFAKRHKTTDMLSLAKLAATEATERKKRGEAKTETINRMMQGVPSPLMDDRREELEAEQTRLAQVLTSTAGGVSQAQMTRWRADLEALDLARIPLDEALQQLPVESPEDTARDKIETLFQILRSHASTFGTERCAVCGNTDGSAIPARVDIVVTERQRLHQLQQGRQTRRSLEAAIAENLEKRRQLVARIQGSTVVPFADDAAQHQAALQAVQQKLAEDDANRRSWQNAEAGRQEAEQLLVQAETLTKLKKLFDRVGKRLLTERKEDFEDRVNFFLPDKTTCSVDLDVGRIGVSRDGGPVISTLSGGQGMQLLFALAAATAPAGSTPSVLISPDRAWSGDTLESTMRALSESEHQVILTSTVEPAHPVEGWTVIRLPASE